ncbi:hypothetical protein AVEN_64355-1 [Araneus ventricosus]|uniref:Uncharacterized protein n=1 Tax=Araneus ventricosus TaxID=182803 RepID=A0A4Y2DC65_ARAVE|nr:hypothetical protein AVEN_64355-1 [Araneus ventricosus]
MYVKRVPIKRALATPFEGPFLVKKRQDKNFVVLVNGQEKVISVDRLKPAVLLSDTTSSNLPYTTNSHERITLPQPLVQSCKYLIMRITLPRKSYLVQVHTGSLVIPHPPYAGMSASSEFVFSLTLSNLISNTGFLNAQGGVQLLHKPSTARSRLSTE